jgi:hypothetical protein
MDNFTVDEMILMYDILVKAITVLSLSYSKEDMDHYHFLREKLYKKINKSSKS